MTVKAFRTKRFDHTHENRSFDELLAELERGWAGSEELVVLLGNLYCEGAEIDAVVIKPRSISVLDFKAYGGKITFSENGPWYADDVEISAGNQGNPFIQLRANKYHLTSTLKRLGELPSRREPNLGHISALVVFERSIEFDHRQLPGKITPWFDVTDMDHVSQYLAQKTSREISLTQEDIEAIVERLGIAPYEPVGPRPRVPADGGRDVASDCATVPECLLGPLDAVREFLESEDRLLVVSGMIGTGAAELMPAIAERARQVGQSPVVMAPSRRLGARYPLEPESLYGHIYDSEPMFTRNEQVFEMAENADADDQLYVVGDAQLVTDRKSTSGDKRFGSGRLLSDLLEFVDLEDSRRKIIFLGDPFQLPYGSVEDTAIRSRKLEAATGLPVRELELEKLLPGREDDPFVVRSIPLAEAISSKAFWSLDLQIDGERCIEAPAEAPERGRLLAQKLREDPLNTKLVAYEHTTVNALNDWVRKEVFGRGVGLTSGDVVQVTDPFLASDAGSPAASVWVGTGTFLEVLGVGDRVEEVVQPLKGRDAPVRLELLDVAARRCGEARRLSFLCLRDHLYADRPGTDTDSAVALRAFAQARVRKAVSEPRMAPVGDLGDPRSPEDGVTDLQEATRRALSRDPYFNAARLRFGYALTLHRARGERFRTVLADLSPVHLGTGETYFRALYTALTLPESQLYVWNVPAIHVLARARWSPEQANPGTVRHTARVSYDPHANEADQEDVPPGMETKELRNLYRHARAVLGRHGAWIAERRGHAYQEAYVVEGANGQRCTLRLHYDKHYRISRIDVSQSSTDEFGEEMRSCLTSGVDFETRVQRELYEALRPRLRSHGMDVVSVRHESYQEIYEIEHEAGKLKLGVNYDGQGFATRLAPLRYEADAVLEAVRASLGCEDES
jgi:hypothetical protein